MKSNKGEILIGIAVAGWFSTILATAGKHDLRDFKGPYRGTVTRSGAGPSLNGTALVRFKIPAGGISGVIDYTATVSDGITTTVLPTSLAMIANENVNVSDLLVGSAGTNNAQPGTGKWSQRKRKLTITSSNGQGTTLNVSAEAKDLRKKRMLTLILTSSDGVNTTTPTTNLKSRLSRNARR